MVWVKKKGVGKRNKLYVKEDSGVVLSSHMRAIDLAPIRKQNHVQHQGKLIESYWSIQLTHYQSRENKK